VGGVSKNRRMKGEYWVRPNTSRKWTVALFLGGKWWFPGSPQPVAEHQLQEVDERRITRSDTA
jgi:hypothetical protein